LLSDFKHAVRSLAKSPRFAIVSVLALAIGAGANTAMFSVVYNVLLKPLAYPHAERLFFLQQSDLRTGDSFPVAPANYADWAAQQHSFQSIASAEAWGASLTGMGRPEQLDALHVSPSLLDVLETSPALGRAFRSDDDHVVLLSYGLWQRRFGGDAQILGRPLTLNGEPYQVIGVMPRGFLFPPFWQEKAELWAPLVFSPSRFHDRSGGSLRIFARLKQGISIQQARAEMAAIARRLEIAYPKTNAGTGASLKPLEDAVAGRVRPALTALLAAVGLLLLIACANVANLLLARATGRQKEIALRIAIGASRARIVRQLLAESFVLSLAGTVCGLLIAYAAVHALTASIPEASRFTLPRYREIGLGAPVLLFAFAVSSLTAFLFGLAPALQFSRPDLSSALKEGGRGSAGLTRGLLRGALVIGEVAISLILLSGAGLTLRSLWKLTAIDSGFDAHNLLSMTVNATASEYKPMEKRYALFRAAFDRVAAIPSVRSVSAINHLPLAGDEWTFPFLVEGQPIPKPEDTPGAVFRVVFPGYFDTMRIALISGRDFTAHDTAAAPRVAIINQSMARRYWPGIDPVGKRFRLHISDPWLIIVGVAHDAEQGDWGAPEQNEYFFPFTQNPEDFQRYATFVVRTASDPAALAPAIEKAVWSLDPDLPIAEVQTMDQVVSRAVWRPRFSASLLGGFAALSLALAAIGLYGVISYKVNQRAQEIGIRMALGARPSDVLRRVLSEGARLAAAGSAIGIAGALLLTRYLETQLYQVKSGDPAVMSLSAAVLAAIALIASWLPARRATRVDPAVALRGE
jgi:putative ABC transport system permease protein